MLRKRLETSQIATASFVGLRGCTAAVVLLTIILLPLHERLHISWRDQPNFVSPLPDLTAPKMLAATSFHNDSTGWQRW
jgi:hypothetical protein